MGSTEIITGSIFGAVVFILFIVFKIKRLNQIERGEKSRLFDRDYRNSGNDFVDIIRDVDFNFEKPHEPFHHPVQDLPENKNKE